MTQALSSAVEPPDHPRPSPQRVIGLTGGIATGKTTVSAYLREHHQIPILDADTFARQAVEPGSPVLAKIQHRYGADILQADGHLNRPRLGEIIFNQPQERQWLEQQIHPIVRSQFQNHLNQPELQQSPIVVCDIPLLFEAHMTDLVNEIWVVTCTPEQQIQRLMQRNHLTHEAATARIASQWPLSQKIAAADIVLENTSTLDHLVEQIQAAL